jgi:hypothetical protein
MVATVIELIVQIQKRLMHEFHVNRMSSFDFTLNLVGFLFFSFFFNSNSVCDSFVGSSPSVYTPWNVGRVGEAVISSSH